MARARTLLRLTVQAFALALALAPSDGAAQTFRQPAETLQTAPIPPGQSPYLPDGRTLSGDGVVIPCQCRFGGRDVPLGTRACMTTPGGTVLAQCELAGNITTWRPTETACTLSFVVPPRAQPPQRVRAALSVSRASTQSPVPSAVVSFFQNGASVFR